MGAVRTRWWGRAPLRVAVSVAMVLGSVSVVVMARPARVHAATTAVTVEQALAQARSTGQAVDATGATTSTDSVQANPDGSLTVNRSAVPVRKLVSGTWTGLDATLKTNADGTVSPSVTTSGLVLSGGGTGPLATMSMGGQSLAVSLNMTLPAPTLAGATATYAGVLSGVDLKVTADVQGGISEALVVQNATAASNPALQSIAVTTQANGLALSADTSGNIVATDRTGRAVFAAPAPLMWDSKAPTGITTVADTGTGTVVDASTGTSVSSSSTGPGEAAATAPVGVAVSGSAITLTPDPSLLGSSSAVYPEYIDPSWSAVGSAKSGWATVSQHFPNTNYWNRTPDPQGYMQVGNVGSAWSHTLINFPINTGVLSGATIASAQLNITENWSYSCTPSALNLYAPGTTLTPGNATWNFWSGRLGNAIASGNYAYGHSASCPAHGIGFSVLGTVVADVAAGKTTQTFALTGVNESSDYNSWKEFLAASPTLSITYNHAPNQPSGLTTSPATTCTGNPPTVVGDGPVSLYAPVSDRDGGNLGVQFALWKTSDTTQTPLAHSDFTLTYPSGQTAVLVVAESVLKNAAAGAITEFSWHARTSDGLATSPWSVTCNLNFDPTRSGPPTVTQSAPATFGQSVQFTVAPPTTGSVPSGYLYQLNAGAPQTVTATNGTATISVVPTRFVNTLTVASLSPGGNIGLDAARAVFNAPGGQSAKDADLTGEGTPDLLTVGGAAVPPGLWVARGTAQGAGNGQVDTSAEDIGANGNGFTGDNSPADFAGAQVITGHFTGSGPNDILAYYPSSGVGAVINGTGDGSVLQPQQSGNEHTLGSGILSDEDGNNPIQIANAYNASGQNNPYPDLIGINGTTGAYYLGYYPTQNGVNLYGDVVVLANLTPTGGTDWDSWTITTTSTGYPGPGMFLRNKSTGALYLWHNLKYDATTHVLSYTPYTIATSGWAAPYLQAAGLNGDTVPDLWAVDSAGYVTPYLVNLPSTGPTITAQPRQQLVTSDHTWPLSDAKDGTVTSAADATGGSALTGTAGVTWHTGDQFDPDAAFDGTGALSAPAALDTTRDFTVSAWVKPSGTGRYVLSQDGTHTSGFVLYADSATNKWTFGMPTLDVAAPTYDIAQSQPVQVGVWTHLAATYSASTHKMALYVNGIPYSTATHSTVWNAAGAFQVGDFLSNGAHTGYFTGQIANVQVWKRTLSPLALAYLSGTAGYVLLSPGNATFPGPNVACADFCTYSWKTAGALMTFKTGQLSIQETGSGTLLKTYGVSCYPSSGRFTLGSDGNMVLYPSGWSSGTANHPNDMAFLQPDGNLVIRDFDGTRLWSSGTNN
jgi:Concanavalin A-like lectin/glucanases superfamily